MSGTDAACIHCRAASAEKETCPRSRLQKNATSTPQATKYPVLPEANTGHVTARYQGLEKTVLEVISPKTAICLYSSGEAGTEQVGARYQEIEAYRVFRLSRTPPKE